MRTPSACACAVVGLLIAVSTSGITSGIASTLTFTESGECYWEAEDPNEVNGVAISPGDHMFIVIDDPVFRSWSENERYSVELSTNHSPKRAWIRHAWADVATGVSTLSGYLNSDARRVLGGATSVQLWSEGRLLVDIPLRKTPSTRQLNACERSMVNAHDDEAEEGH